jgi:hypothetical protein
METLWKIKLLRHKIKTLDFQKQQEKMNICINANCLSAVNCKKLSINIVVYINVSRL